MQMAVAISLGLAAAVEDIARRRISNWIPVVALTAGVVTLSIERGWRGALSSVGGALGGFLVFLIFYCLGGMGGGDVKLMAGLGAVVGVEHLVEAALWTAGLGGLLAGLCVALAALKGLWNGASGGSRRVESIPYAPAIALGSWLALLPKT
ncbi:MAG: prepilin peptidase [Acidobacteria bacterium]|nr:prepilin peptidase [Acidobacteriota bacterium]